MELIIKTCGDCPFLTDTFDTCSLMAKIENRNFTQEKDEVEYKYGKGWVIPKWCPLHKDTVLVKLNKANVMAELPTAIEVYHTAIESNSIWFTKWFKKNFGGN